MYDSRVARENMIRSQLRPNRIYSVPLLEAIFNVARETFVPPHLQKVAYIDEDIAISPDRYLIEPVTFARLVQIANIDADTAVLDIGCGTGYSTAVISRLAKSVVAIEENALLFQQAQQNLTGKGFGNATVINAPHSEGYAAKAPFDVIFIGGRLEMIPDFLIDQLAPEGRLVTVMEEDGVGRAVTIRKTSKTLAEMVDFDAMIPLMPGFARKRTFAL